MLLSGGEALVATDVFSKKAYQLTTIVPVQKEILIF